MAFIPNIAPPRTLTMRPTPEQEAQLLSRSRSTTCGYNACVAVWRALGHAGRVDIRNKTEELTARAQRFVEMQFASELTRHACAQDDVTYGITAAALGFRDCLKNSRAPTPVLLEDSTFRVRVSGRCEDFTLDSRSVAIPGIGDVALDPFSPDVRPYERHPYSGTVRKAAQPGGPERWVIRFSFTKDPFYSSALKPASSPALETAFSVPSALIEE